MIKQKETVEVYAGTKSFSKVAEKLGYKSWTTDNNPDCNCDLTGDIFDREVQKKILEKVKTASMVWMSPVCKTWSLSAGNTYWDEFRFPRNDKAINGIKMMMNCRFIADYCVKHGIIFFIENPNGRAVWIMDNKYLHRVWYCQYGDTRAKPTNIWTNLPNWKPKTCKNGNPDCNHERAPRGSKTGTQGLKGNMDRSVVPPQLCEELIKCYEEEYGKN